MKKLAIAVMAFALLSSTSAFAMDRKKGKKKKAQTCTQADCKKAGCPEMPNCHKMTCASKCGN
jgi:hypothetical protein